MSKKREVTILTDDNYFVWKYEVELVLRLKGLWDHAVVPSYLLKSLDQSGKVESIDGSGKEKSADKITETSTRMTSAEWLKDDQKALAIIALSVSQKFYSITKGCETCVEA